MSLDAETGLITWRIHFASSRESVYAALSTDEGRARFWAESAIERDGVIEFVFPNGMRWNGRILERKRPERFSVDYFGCSVAFTLEDDGAGGTDLTLTDRGEPADDREETHAGWVSVLMTLKGQVDFGVDLRNHDPERSWDSGFADN
jgi:uncharacterized protein YndB with AHSA1/START domain